MDFVTGRITAVQEDRFLLAADEGPALLLTVAHASGVGLRDLERWLRTGERVTVAFDGRPNLASGVAHAIHAVARRAA